jgi:hypothetical protein
LKRNQRIGDSNSFEENKKKIFFFYEWIILKICLSNSIDTWVFPMERWRGIDCPPNLRFHVFCGRRKLATERPLNYWTGRRGRQSRGWWRSTWW